MVMIVRVKYEHNIAALIVDVRQNISKHQSQLWYPVTF